MTTPIETMINAVEFTLVEGPLPVEGLYATHSGVLEIMGFHLRCYRLNDGQTVFDADDFEKMWGVV